jgi:histidinol-phosphate aminotransferase
MSGAYQKIEGRDGKLALDMNECLFPRPETITRILAGVTPGRYGAYPEYGELVEAISRRYDLPVEWLRPTAGADEGISVCVAAFLGPGKRIAVPEPVFSMYDVRAGALGAQFARVKLDADWKLPVDDYIAKARGADLAVLVNPGNPAGCVLARAEVERIAQALAPIPVCVDEAYMDFPNQSAVSLLRTLPNLIFLRSFSKSFGLAGLRVGWLAARPELMERLEAFVLPYGISRPSAEVALGLVNAPELPGILVAPTLEARAANVRLFKKYFQRSIETDANFTLTYVGEGAGRFKGLMAANGVLVKAWDIGPMAGWMRVSVFPKEYEAAVERALAASKKEFV